MKYKMNYKMNNKSCKIGIVVGAAPIKKEKDYLIHLIRNSKEAYIVAADGGIEFFLKESEIEPNEWIGDMDSTDSKRILVRDVKNAFPNLVIKTCSPIKDDTDMAIGLKILAEQNCKSCYIFGGVGGDRFDHTFANIALMYGYAKKHIDVKLVSNDSIIHVLNSEGEVVSLNYEKRDSGIISIFSLTDKTEIVKIEGLFYEYEGPLYNYKALGVSNEFCGKPARLTVKDGAILIIDKNIIF